MLFAAGCIPRAALPRNRQGWARSSARIYYLCCYSDFASSLAHYQIARMTFPDTYRQIITLPKLWFIKINTAARWPFFSLSDKPFGPKETKLLGPFPTRKAVAEFADIIHQGFALCRQPKLIDNPAKAASCPYLQMQICLAPCVDKTGRAEYLQRIAEAISAAGAGPEQLTTGLQARMRRLAAETKFEQAGLVKKQLLRITQSRQDSFR